MKRFISFIKQLVMQPFVIPILAVLIVANISVLSSCKTCRQAEVSSNYNYSLQSDSNKLVSLRVDSILIKDSIFTLVKGDSVFTDRWHSEFRDRLRVDTIEKLKIKTVYITRTERVTVTPKKPPSSQMGGTVWFLLNLALSCFLLYKFIKFKMRTF